MCCYTLVFLQKNERESQNLKLMLHYPIPSHQKEETTLAIPNTPLLLGINLNQVMPLATLCHTKLYLIHFVVLLQINLPLSNLDTQLNLIPNEVCQVINLECPNIFPEYLQQPYLLPDLGCPTHTPHSPQLPRREHAHLRQCRGNHHPNQVIPLQLQLVISDFPHHRESGHQIYHKDHLFPHNSTMGDLSYPCIFLKVRLFNMVK
jgi:hypothetical protein